MVWNGSAITADVLAVALNRMAAMKRQPELQFEPHANARYDRISEVLTLIKRANISTMGMVGNERYAAF